MNTKKNTTRTLAITSLFFLFAIVTTSQAMLNGQDPKKAGLNANFPIDSIHAISVGSSKGDGYCTGTFLNDQVMLTAAHCMSLDQDVGKIVKAGTEKDLRDLQVEDVASGAKAIDVFIFSSHVDNDTANDIAIVVFPKNTYKGSSFLKLDLTTRIQGPFLFFGAGTTSTNSMSDKVTRVGFLNDLSRTSIEWGKINIEKTNVLPLDGDSGGPIVLNSNNAIVGVVHSSSERKKLAIFTRVGGREEVLFWFNQLLRKHKPLPAVDCICTKDLALETVDASGKTTMKFLGESEPHIQAIDALIDKSVVMDEGICETLNSKETANGQIVAELEENSTNKYFQLSNCHKPKP